MKKKVGIVFILGMTLFLLFYHRVNAGKPKDLEVKRYDFGEKISYEDIDFTVEKGQIINQDGLDLLPIIYTIKNEGNKKIDASDLILRIFYRNGLSNDEICQNVVEPNVNLDPDEFSIKKSIKLMILLWIQVKKKPLNCIITSKKLTMKSILPA